MANAETSLSSPGSTVGTSITATFNKADNLAVDPRNTSLRLSFLQSVNDVATAFRTTSKALTKTAVNIIDDAASAVRQVNTDLTALSGVNTVLLRAKPGSTGQASLLDQRDRLLDDIASKVAITTSFSTGGTVAVGLAGVSGIPLLATNILNPPSIASQPNGSFSVNMAGGVVTPSGGYLGGLLGASTDLATRRGSLDALAMQFGSQINAQQAVGFDQNGNPGTPLLDVSGGNADSLNMLIVTAAQVAAADTGTSNGNMLAYAVLRGANGVETGWASLVAGQSQATASANTQHASASALDDAAQSERSQQSTVNLNQQAADLLRYQQAYQASAKVLSTAKEILQSILSIN
jgi:flagellar hook-associated protein 1 FlgK